MRKLNTLLIMLFICGCQSNDRASEFERIKVGMSKSEVLAEAGSPHWSDRHQGQDRWFYYLKPLQKQERRVVYFENGVVVLKGLRTKPLLSAEEMEEVKKPRSKTKDFKPRYSEKQLKKLIKQEIKKEEKKQNGLLN